jgi:hypothetical protein
MPVSAMPMSAMPGSAVLIPQWPMPGTMNRRAKPCARSKPPALLATAS